MASVTLINKRFAHRAGMWDSIWCQESRDTHSSQGRRKDSHPAYLSGASVRGPPSACGLVPGQQGSISLPAGNSWREHM